MMPGLNSASNARKQNMAHLLTSQEVMERLRSGLTDYYNAEGRPNSLRVFFPGSVCISSSELRDLIYLSWDRNSDIYSIRCSAENPDGAYALCLAFMNTMQTYYPEIGQRDAMMKRDFLARQISSLTCGNRGTGFNLADFQKKSPDFINFMMMDVEEKGRQRLRGELTQLKEQLASNRAIKQLLLHVPQAKRGEHTSLQPAIGALDSQTSELQYQIKLTEQSTNPDRDERLRTLNEELSKVSARLAKLNDEEVSLYMRNPLNSADLRQKVANLELDYRVGLIKVEAPGEAN